MPSHYLIISDTPSNADTLSQQASKPRFASNGDICVALAGSVFTSGGVGVGRYIDMYKSTDGGETWSTADWDNSPVARKISYGTTDVPVDLFQVGDTLTAAYFDRTTQLLKLQEFSMATMTWGSVIATGGPQMYAPTDSNDAGPISGLALYIKSSRYVVQYRAPNENYLGSLFTRTRTVQWTAAGGWETPSDTLYWAAVENCSNNGGILDESGHLHLFGTRGSGIAVPPLLSVNHQRLSATGTLGAINTIYEGDGAFPYLSLLAPMGFAQPVRVGSNVTFGVVAGFGTSGDGDPDHRPSIQFCRFTAGESPSFTLSDIFDVSSADYFERRGGGCALLYGTSDAGIVTSESSQYNLTRPIYYHDLSDVVEAGKYLVIWPHYRDRDSGADYATCYGAIYDGSTFGTPFTVYESTLQADQTLYEIHGPVYPDECCDAPCAMVF